MDKTAVWNYLPLRKAYVLKNLPGYIKTLDIDY